MSQTYGTPPGGGFGGDYEPRTDTTDSTRDVAADEARGVAGDAKAAGQQTAATAKDQATQVAGEAKMQARQVFDQAKQELGSQVQGQHQRAAGGLNAVADELTSMLKGEGSQDGVVSDLAQQASDRVRSLAQWLESREPADVLDEVRSFARRRPGAFLAGAAVVGFVGGRMTRGIADEARDQQPGQPTGKRAAAYQPVTDFETETAIGGIPAPQHAYDQAPTGLSTMPATSPPPLVDPLTGDTGTYGGELRR